MVKSTRVFHNPYNAYCDVYACRNRAAYFIGRPDATKAATYKVCAECMAAILSNLDNDLAQIVTQNAPNEETTNEGTSNLPDQSQGEPQAPEQQERVARAFPLDEPNTSAAQEDAKRAEFTTQLSEPSQMNEEEEEAKINHDAEERERLEEASNPPKEQSNPPEEEEQAQSTEESLQKVEEQLQDKTVEELKALAKDIGVKGVSKMKKDELVEVLLKGENTVDE